MRYVVFLILLAGGGYLFVNHYWQKFRLLNRRFNYRITDIWAAMLGLSPTMIMAAIVNEQKLSPKDLIFWITGTIALAIVQIGGLAAGRMDIEIRESELGPVNAMSSAISIVTGALLGLLFGFILLPFAAGVANLF